jgi:bifunctional DNA-binding transcriptional regulator/antitoxin component of YhaV-PrlF toxin-antitoxin module
MELVKLGKSGQVSIPRAILRRLGLSGDQTFIVEAADDGSIVLRQAAVYPVEIYSEARVREFEDADRITPDEAARLARSLEPSR